MQPASSPTPSRSRWQLVQYLAVVVLYWAGLYLYVPTLPVYVQTRTDRLEMIGVVVSMYGLWQALLRLPLGILSDWVGRRKPFILVGLALVGFGAWMMGAAPAGASGLNAMIIGRSITGLAAATWVLLVVVFSSIFPPKEAVRAAAILTLAGSLARFAATSLTGTLNNLGGYPLAYTFAGGLSLAAVVLYAFTHETPRPPRQPSLAATGRLISRRDVLVPALVNAVFHYTGQASTYGFIPILAKEMGANDIQQSLLVSMSIALFALGNLSATWAARRFSNRSVVLFSLALAASGMAAAALAPTLPLVFLAQFFTGLAGGASYPVLMGMSIEHVADEQRSTAMGLHQSVYAIGMFAGPWLSGILADAIGIRPMFGYTAGAALVLGLAGVRWLGKKHPEPPHPST